MIQQCVAAVMIASASLSSAGCAVLGDVASESLHDAAVANTCEDRFPNDRNEQARCEFNQDTDRRSAGQR